MAHNIPDLFKNNRYKRLHIIACQVLWRELSYFSSQSENVFTMSFLPQGLHDTPDFLRERLQKEVDEAEKRHKDGERIDAIILGYGLCCNGIVSVTAKTIPIVILKAHDCITFLLGSRQRYEKYFNEHGGTYWYSPGWLDTTLMPGKERVETTKAYYEKTYGKDNADFLMSMEQDWLNKYDRCAFVDLNTQDSERYKEQTRLAAEYLRWKADFLEGDSTLIKDMLEGNWDSERFIVLEAGDSVEPSYDESVIKKKADA